MESRSEINGASLETAKNPVDTLTKEELLAFSAQIKVGETSLRRVYEAKMVDEAGLRRLIKEYQAGHDLRRALAREFMVKELKFERDPTLRNLLPPEVQPKKSSESLSQHSDDAVLLASGGVVNSGEHGGTAQNSKTSDSSQQTGIVNNLKHGKTSVKYRRQTTVSPELLVALTLATAALAVYALWLTFTR